jgi:hypothetical protein
MSNQPLDERGGVIAGAGVDRVRLSGVMPS